MNVLMSAATVPSGDPIFFKVTTSVADNRPKKPKTLGTLWWVAHSEQCVLEFPKGLVSASIADMSGSSLAFASENRMLTCQAFRGGLPRVLCIGLLSEAWCGPSESLTQLDKPAMRLNGKKRTQGRLKIP
eukprot:593645-Amphidinium_carterae.1